MKPVVEDNLKLAWKEAHKYYCKFRFKWKLTVDDREDMCQEAVIAMSRAADKFDPGRGVQFSTYATTAIRNHLNTWLHWFGGTVRIPAHVPDPRRYDTFFFENIKDGRGHENDNLLEREEANVALGQLAQPDREILQQHYGIGCDAKTQFEISKESGLSRQRVSQKVLRAEKRLRAILEAKGMGNG